MNIKIILSLGSNIGDKDKNIDSAVAMLAAKVNSLNVSKKIITKAILKDDMPVEWNIDFLNAVAFGNTELSPIELLSFCKEIEVNMGRDLHAPRWSPRVIDIDILYYGDEVVDLPNLKIPHPEIKNRTFLKELGVK